MNTERYVGIDIGGTNCRGALLSTSGDLSPLRRMPTPADVDLESFLSTLEAFCRGLIEEAKGERVAAVGMGVPGVIGTDGTVHASPNLPILNGVPLARRLKETLGLPVHVVNDASAAAWGEALWGAGRHLSSFIVLTLGTGVGGGLVLNRRLWTGADGAAAEAGHLVVDPQGIPCGCGSRGCLEQYASATAIVRAAQKALDAGCKSLLESVEPLCCESIAKAARDGDELARGIFCDAGRMLGLALASVANLLNLDGAVIAGGASAALDLMLPSLEEELFFRAFDIPARRLKVVRGELGDQAGILGSGGLAIHPEIF